MLSYTIQYNQVKQTGKVSLYYNVNLQEVVPYIIQATLADLSSFIHSQTSSLLNMNVIIECQIYLLKEMTQAVNKYKFDNLQPINFLKKFNKMVDDDQKNPIKSLSKELKVFQLSKFPLPEFYEKMQGIFETGARKKDIVGLSLKNKEDLYDEEFLEKHRQFMGKAIQKIIADNQEHQENLQEYKKQYAPTRPPPLESSRRVRSESRFKKTTRSLASSYGNDHLKEPQTAKFERPESPHTERTMTYLEKVQQDRMEIYKNPHKQKIRVRNNRELQDFMSSRENFSMEKKIKPSQGGLSLPRVEYNNLNPQDRKKEFIENLLTLQKEQNKYQSQFARKVEKEIQRFNGTIKHSVEKSKDQKFW